jgi:hypothetical protein
MATLTAKQINEREAFVSFVKRQGKESEWKEISSRPEPEPDLLCVNSFGEHVAFELVSLTDPEIAKVQAAGLKAHTNAFWTSDPSERIVRNKLSKSYKTDAHHIELLIYTNGQIITPDDAIIPTIEPWLNAIQHPFKRIWFMGEHETRCLWRAA